MIIGNTQQQKILREWLEQDKGCFLLVGPEGVGKFSFCLDLIRSKDWEKIIFKSDDKLMKIETARLLTSLSYRKTLKRIVLIDDFHKFQKQSQNTLLKTLEEAPSQTIFILVTHQLNKILPTIRSRCLILRFNLLSFEETLQVLKLRNYQPEKVKFLLEIFPGQPGKIIKLLQNQETKLKLIQKFFLADDFEKITLLEDLKNCFSLKEFLEIYFLIKRKQLAEKKNYSESKKLKEILDLYSDADYNLNFELQLANLIFNYG